MIPALLATPNHWKLNPFLGDCPRGDISKLQRYKALGVNEVWIWEDGTLNAYHLQSGDYQTVSRSLIPALSTLDLRVMSECILLGETSRLKAGKKLLSTLK